MLSALQRNVPVVSTAATSTTSAPSVDPGRFGVDDQNVLPMEQGGDVASRQSSCAASLHSVQPCEPQRDEARAERLREVHR